MKPKSAISNLLDSSKRLIVEQVRQEVNRWQRRKKNRKFYCSAVKDNIVLRNPTSKDMFDL